MQDKIDEIVEQDRVEQGRQPQAPPVLIDMIHLTPHEQRMHVPSRDVFMMSSWKSVSWILSPYSFCGTRTKYKTPCANRQKKTICPHVKAPSRSLVSSTVLQAHPGAPRDPLNKVAHAKANANKHGSRTYWSVSLSLVPVFFSRLSILVAVRCIFPEPRGMAWSRPIEWESFLPIANSRAKAKQMRRHASHAGRNQIIFFRGNGPSLSRERSTEPSTFPRRGWGHMHVGRRERSGLCGSERRLSIVRPNMAFPVLP
jgi:hypothetical protein